MKQYVLHLDETKKLGRSFVIQDLDETHVFISVEILRALKEEIEKYMDEINFIPDEVPA